MIEASVEEGDMMATVQSLPSRKPDIAHRFLDLDRTQTEADLPRLAHDTAALARVLELMIVSGRQDERGAGAHRDDTDLVEYVAAGVVIYSAALADRTSGHGRRSAEAHA